MRIQFCGADRTVTGSCHLIEVSGLRILLDMGLYQGPREEARRLNEWLPPGAEDVDALILSHGHLDHCGKLPVLVRAGYAGPIYCTPPTAAVARIVLYDSAEIQEENAEYLNRRVRNPDEPPVRALYTVAELPGTMRLFRTVPYGRRMELGNEVSFTFHDAGHILGSAYVVLEWSEQGQPKRLLFTADVGRYGTPILRDPATLPGPVDQVITESTYGGAVHAPMEQVGPQLLESVKRVIADGGRLLVPSFAVGRTQTILWYMQRFITEGSMPALPIFVDSPMGVEVSKVHSDFRDYYDQETSGMIGTRDLFGLSRVTFASSRKESQRINAQSGPCVIIASSPTCEFGRILHHLKFSIENERDMVIFVGWTPYQTLGRRLQDGEKRARILDQWYDVKCKVRTIHGLSAHADGDELLRFLAPTIRKETAAYVVHGEVPQAETFAGRLIAGGMGRAAVPAMESSAVEYSVVAPTVVKPTKPAGDD
jgi:metallo-beta-lactamase family protein